MMDFVLGSSQFIDLDYEEVDEYTDENTSIYKDPVKIKGLRLKGQLKVIHGTDGDSTTCSIVYKVQDELIAGSKLNNREIMECVPLSMSKGYRVYVK